MSVDRDTRLRRKFVDLCIQLECREADACVEDERYEEALGFVAAARARFETADKSEIDDRTRDHLLRQLAGVMPRLRRNFVGTTRASEIKSHQEWLGAISRQQTEGRESRWVDREGDRSTVAIAPDRIKSASKGSLEGRVVSLVEFYGFIDTNDGRRFFFHRNHLVDRMEFSNLEIGSPVSFYLGHNDQGVCAVDVRVLA